MTQSGNDVGAMHRVLHTCFKSPAYKYDDTTDLPGAAVADLKWLLHDAGLRGKQKETYWKCLMHSPDFLNVSTRRT
jgi:hypothetical protein